MVALVREREIKVSSTSQDKRGRVKCQIVGNSKTFRGGTVKKGPLILWKVRVGNRNSIRNSIQYEKLKCGVAPTCARKGSTQIVSSVI